MLERSFHDEMADFVRQFSFDLEFEKYQYNLKRYSRDDLRIDLWGSGTLGIYRDGKQEFHKNLSRAEMKERIANL